ncbi:MAG: hypothetical protein LBR08_08965 [Bacteroidales bacterium]|jgi:hypothetical protein|nr:hypothetical protein [Bacteroidales bacterium]
MQRYFGKKTFRNSLYRPDEVQEATAQSHATQQDVDDIAAGSKKQTTVPTVNLSACKQWRRMMFRVVGVRQQNYPVRKDILYPLAGFE